MNLFCAILKAVEDSALKDTGFTQEETYKSQQYFKQPEKKPKRFVYIIIILLIIGGAVFGGKQFLGSFLKTSPAITPTPTPTKTEEFFPTDTPTPTESQASPTPSIKPTLNPVDKSTGLDRSELSVEVQNGSGVVGAASKASEALKLLGYHVVSIGNADNFDYENVTINVKSDKSSYLSLLKKDLENTYTIGSTSATLSASSAADALVVIGK